MWLSFRDSVALTRVATSETLTKRIAGSTHRTSLQKRIASSGGVSAKMLCEENNGPDEPR